MIGMKTIGEFFSAQRTFISSKNLQYFSLPS